MKQFLFPGSWEKLKVLVSAQLIVKDNSKEIAKKYGFPLKNCMTLCRLKNIIWDGDFQDR